MAKQETNYNKLVGRIGESYYFLDGIFKYSDDFQGATGTVLTPVTKASYDERIDPDNLKEYLEEHWQMAVEAGSTRLGLDDWAEMVIDTDGADETAFDTSGWYGKEWEQLRALGMTEEDYPVFEWESCGRIFSKGMKFDQVYAPELIKLIDKAETKQ